MSREYLPIEYMRTLISLTLTTIVLASCSTLNLNKGKLTFSKKKDNHLEFIEKDENESSQVRLEENSFDEGLLASTTSMDAIKTKEHSENVVTPFVNMSTKDPSCDKILLKTGEEIEAKVLEIGVQEIKYKNCTNLQGPTISILKSDAFMITYSNGSKEVFKEASQKSTANAPNNTNQYQTGNTQKRTNGFSIASLILGILGVPVLGLIFGSIAMSQIRKNPEKQSGYGMAVAGTVLSTIGLFLLLFILFIL